MKPSVAHDRALVRSHASGKLLRAGSAAARVKAGLPISELDFEVDAHSVENLTPGRLPRHWLTARGLSATQQIGDQWLQRAPSLALAVPSVVVPEEINYLINPEHPEFRRLSFGRPIPFVLDDRHRTARRYARRRLSIRATPTDPATASTV